MIGAKPHIEAPASSPGPGARLNAVRANHTLRWQLTLAVGALLCGCIGFVAVQSLTFLTHEMRQTIQLENTAFLKSLSQHLDSALHESELDLADLGTTMPRALLHDPVAAHRYLENRIGMRRLFDGGLYLYTASGDLIAGARVPAHHRDPAEYAALHALLTTGRPQISEPYRHPGNADSPKIAFFSPILVKGHLAGILEGALRLDGHNVIASVPHTYVGKAGYVFLADRHGHVIAHPDSRRLMTKLSDPTDTLPLADLLAGHAVTAESYTVHGQPMLTSIRRLRTTGWLVGINLPQAEAFSPMIGARHYIIFGALGLLVIILIAMGEMMRRLMTPLETITEQIHAISRSGHSDGHRIVLDTPPRELAQLARGFNEMLETLEAHRDEAARRERRFRSLIEDSPDTIAVIDQDGALTFVSPSSFGEHFDWTEFAMKPALDFMHPDDREDGQAAILRVLQNPEQTATLDCRVRDRAGRYRHYETILHNRLADPDIQGIVLSTRDITERRAAEAAVRLEGQRLRVALECADLAVFNQDRALRYIWSFNSQIFADMEQMIGKTDDDLLPDGPGAQLTRLQAGHHGERAG